MEGASRAAASCAEQVRRPSAASQNSVVWQVANASEILEGRSFSREGYREGYMYNSTVVASTGREADVTAGAVTEAHEEDSENVVGHDLTTLAGMRFGGVSAWVKDGEGKTQKPVRTLCRMPEIYAQFLKAFVTENPECKRTEMRTTMIDAMGCAGRPFPDGFSAETQARRRFTWLKYDNKKN